MLCGMLAVILKHFIKLGGNTMSMTTAKLFQNGKSQAVRLPKQFRFQGNEVKISKQGNKIILEPIEN